MPSDRIAPFLDEERAVQVVLEAIEDGLQRLHASTDRMLLRGLKDADLRLVRDLERSLAELSAQIADREVYGGRYGELLVEALKKGAATAADVVGAISVRVDPEMIRVALWPARLQIKDLTDAAAQSITELTSKAMTAGWSPRELSERIQQEVTLSPAGEGGPYSVPEWRAELMARNEPMKVYRESAAGAQGWDDDTLLKMFGPDDARTDGDVCSEYVGKVMTLAEWEAITWGKSGICDPRGYGFHPN